jgi:hypothetical protein
MVQSPKVPRGNERRRTRLVVCAGAGVCLHGMFTSHVCACVCAVRIACCLDTAVLVPAARGMCYAQPQLTEEDRQWRGEEEEASDGDAPRVSGAPRTMAQPPCPCSPPSPCMPTVPHAACMLWAVMTR